MTTEAEHSTLLWAAAEVADGWEAYGDVSPLSLEKLRRVVQAERERRAIHVESEVSP